MINRINRWFIDFLVQLRIQMNKSHEFSLSQRHPASFYDQEDL